LVALVVLSVCGGEAVALTDEEIFRAFQFNFVNPGARSVGLGGAFIAAADDATAAQANPAALHYLSRMEFFAEYRVTQPATTVFGPTGGTVGSLDIPPVLPYLDLQSVNAPEDVNSLSFVSFAYPFRVGSKGTKMRFAFSRQVVLDVETSLSAPGLPTSLTFSPETFPTWVNPASGQVEQYAVRNDVTGTLDAEIVHYNLGFSTSLSQDFSLGVTATWATLDMKSSVDGIVNDPRGLLNFVNPRLDPDGDGLFSAVGVSTRISDTDEAFGYTVGLHWHPDAVFPGGYSPIRFGFVYRKGAELAVPETVYEGTVQIDSFENVLKVPDRFGLGASYEFGRKRQWTAALDVERIEYEDLLEGFQVGVNFFTSGLLPADALEIDPNLPITYTVDDATVFHLGLEYNNRSRGGWNQSVRAGYYNAPDSRIRMTQFNSTNQAINELFLDVFRGGEDDDHYTVGFSIGKAPSRGQSLTFQLAGDFSDASDIFVGSLLWRFGKTGQ
jgi:hypothetical protein